MLNALDWYSIFFHAVSDLDFLIILVYCYPAVNDINIIRKIIKKSIFRSQHCIRYILFCP